MPSRSISLSLSVATLVALACAACTGSIADRSDAPSRPPVDDPVRVPTAEACAGALPSVAPAPLLRLTRRHYQHTLEDLFDVDPAAVITNLPVDAKQGGFSANHGPPTESQSITKYSEVAAALAASIDLAAQYGCTSAACEPDFVSSLGRRLFRRPLLDDERARFEDLFTLGRGELGLDAHASAQLVLEAMLQSPGFLVRGEEAVATSEPEGPVLLDGFEIATRLSYFLFQSSPDDTLLASAAAGALDTREGVEAETRRMLEDPRSARALVDFHFQWLWLRTGDGEHWPNAPAVEDELYAAMVAETERFVVDVARDGTLGDLFTAPWSYLNEPLAEVYGVDGVVGPDLRRLELPAEERSGVLTQPLFIATHHRSPRIRPVPLGNMIRDRVLCEGLPPPPPNIPELPTDETLTAREVAALHSEDPACGNCHRLMDPIGFAWSRYDPIGRYLVHDAEGVPIDASGELVDAGDASGPVDGVAELAERLAGSDKVGDCYAESWFAFALGRALEDADACSRVTALERFRQSGQSIAELILGIVASDAFRYRHATGPSEEMCQ